MAKKVDTTEKKREKLMRKLSPQDELRVMEKKLKKEGSSKLLEEADEEEEEYKDEHMVQEDGRHRQELEDKEVEEGIKEGFISGEKPEEVYDLEEAEELVEDDEITSAEEGFSRGYEDDEEKQFNKKPKKKK